MTTYLGLDISTQQLKAVVVNAASNVVHSDAVNFEKDLPQYKTEAGVHRHDDGVTVTAPPLMWVEAFDVLLQRLKSTIDLFHFVKSTVQHLARSSIVAVSGCGQQHGSVYWKHDAAKLLASLDSAKTLHEQLAHAFATDKSPIWMDASTDEECAHLTTAVGGAQALADITGSSAHHRFTGAQIVKIIRKQPDVYKDTERISLVSSFGASLLLGAYAPIDYADGSGMNLLALRTRQWHEPLLYAVDSENPAHLSKLLGTPSPLAVLGAIAPYYIQRYSFSKECRVVTFTGDNPASMVGMRITRGDIIISWGTSDTVLVPLHDYKADPSMHVLCHPIDKTAFMGMLCFKNGALVRDRIRTECGCANWSQYDQLLNSTPPGNNGAIGMYFDMVEILPPVTAGRYRYDNDDNVVDTFDMAIEARAVFEHQCIAKRVHAAALGFVVGERGRILATGGASNNRALMQICADVFQLSVYTQACADSAALGGALAAMRAVGEKVPDDAAHFDLVAQPRREHAAVYDKLCERYKALEVKLPRV